MICNKCNMPMRRRKDRMNGWRCKVCQSRYFQRYRQERLNDLRKRGRESQRSKRADEFGERLRYGPFIREWHGIPAGETFRDKARRNEQDRQRYAANLDKSRNKVRIDNNARRANLAKVKREPLPTNALDIIVKQQRNKCPHCGGRFTKSDPATLDHIVPLALQGEHTMNNLQAMHKSCNSAKQAMSPAEYAASLGRLL